MKKLPFNGTFGPYAGKDTLSRKLPFADRVGGPKGDRYVGMFYFINLAWKNGRPLHDNAKILKETPEAFHDIHHPAWDTDACYWGEPLFGYYSDNDEWVIRRHAVLLTMADIDFIVFDVTNAIMFADNALTVMKIFNEYLQAGWNVPKVVFYTNSSPVKSIQEVYDTVYAQNLYPDLWFRWEGKPLLIGRPENCSEEIRSFFTFRHSQWPTEKGPSTDAFPWMSFERPQYLFRNGKGEGEVMSVSAAQHPQICFGDSAFYGERKNRGRSYHRAFYTEENDAASGAVNWGYNIAEQWEYAISCDPKIVFVTGWNEWTAHPFLRPECPERPVGFVDTASQEYSRDLEPMKGGHFDLYYMQLIDYVRRFKGCAPWPERREHEINLENGFDQWNDIAPEYYGFPYLEQHRSSVGMTGERYTNNTGRNNFDILKVSRAGDTISFYAKCYDDINLYNFSGKMILLLKVRKYGCDPDEFPSWEGYHFILNHEQIDGATSILYRCLGGWRWEPAATVPFRIDGKEVAAAVPLKELGLSQTDPFELEFKWADNLKETENAEDFYLNGCCAPYGRLNFVYRTSDYEKAGAPVKP
ncbi:MAG TPA: hypothetical protein VHO71_01685 [Caproiciproducens sp.]|nr:hypothetical protein [Caproiciproducens sp.]